MTDTPPPKPLDRGHPPVVFLHGWAGSARGTWLASGIPDLLRARGRDCIVPDLPGHGIASSGAPPSHRPPDYDTIVEQVSAGLPDGPMDLVGYSLGAKIALCIAVRAPHRVRRLALVAVGDNIFAPEGSGALLGEVLARGIGPDTPERLRRMAVYAFQSGADPLALAACLRRSWTPPTEEALRAIRVPVLVALAEHDELVRSAVRLCASLPEATTRILAGQDHLSAPYAPELADLIVHFMTDLRPTSVVAGAMIAKGARTMSDAVTTRENAGSVASGPSSQGPPGLATPPLELDEPGTFLFTPQRALNGGALNRFALSLRWPENRAAFLKDQDGYGASYGMTKAEIAMIHARDWSGLLRHGGHLQAMLKLAVTLGEDLWHIGAHSVGCSRDDLFAIGPRPAHGLPLGVASDTPGASDAGAPLWL